VRDGASLIQRPVREVVQALKSIVLIMSNNKPWARKKCKTLVLPKNRTVLTTGKKAEK
jgi:hypothetical protein